MFHALHTVKPRGVVLRRLFICYIVSLCIRKVFVKKFERFIAFRTPVLGQICRFHSLILLRCFTNRLRRDYNRRRIFLSLG